MIRHRAAAALLVAAALLAGCEHAEDRRWGSAEFTESPTAKTALDTAGAANNVDFLQPYVAVYAYPTAPKAAATSGQGAGAGGLTIKDLLDHGQAALIQACTADTAKCGALLAALAKAPPSDAATPSPQPAPTKTQFDLTVVATVSKGAAARPGDRLVWTRVFIVPDNFAFTGYTVVATDNKTLSVEHVQDVTTASLQGQASATLPVPSKVGLGATASLSNQRTSSTDVNQQYENLGVDIRPNFLSILRESERNLDVAGNTLINLSAVIDATTLRRMAAAGASPPIEWPVFLASGVQVTTAGKLLPPAAAKLTVTQLNVPPYRDLTAKVWLVWQYRRILSGSEDYAEGNQVVRYETDATPGQRIIILPRDQVVPALWAIHDAPGNCVGVATITGDREYLMFANYDTAREVAAWMVQQKAVSIGSPTTSLTLGGNPFPAAYPQLVAQRYIPSDSSSCNYSH